MEGQITNGPASETAVIVIIWSIVMIAATFIIVSILYNEQISDYHTAIYHSDTTIIHIHIIDQKCNTFISYDNST